MAYLKILEVFVLSILMDKTEYNFGHKNFKPIKLVTIVLLFANLIFTVYLLVVLNRTYLVIEKECPVVFEKIAKKKVKEVKVDKEKK